jgi:nitrite reductase/ring-hydroxylating ferredoxin subunit
MAGPFGPGAMVVESKGRPALFACAATDVSPNQAFRVCFPNRPPITIFNLDGEFFALDDTCSHGQASLCEGFVENGQVECPYHSALFDIRTGEALTRPATEPVKAWPVEIADGKIYIVVE